MLLTTSAVRTTCCPSPESRTPWNPCGIACRRWRATRWTTCNAAAAELIAGPEKGVKGPFIPLLRSPRLLTPLQQAGEYLRFTVRCRGACPSSPRSSCRGNGRSSSNGGSTSAGDTGGHEPRDDRSNACRAAAVFDERGRGLCLRFLVELTTHRGLSDATYAECIERFGERGMIDLVGLIGYFTLMSMVLNVARTPPNEVPGVAALPALPR